MNDREKSIMRLHPDLRQQVRDFVARRKAQGQKITITEGLELLVEKGLERSEEVVMS